MRLRPQRNATMITMLVVGVVVLAIHQLATGHVRFVRRETDAGKHDYAVVWLVPRIKWLPGVALSCGVEAMLPVCRVWSD